MNEKHEYKAMNHLDKADVMHEMKKRLDKDSYIEILDSNIESGQIIVVDTINEIVTLYKITSYKSVLLGNYMHDIYKVTNSKEIRKQLIIELYNQGIKDNTDWGY